MADFSALHDTLVDTLSPPTNFSNETVSSAVFLVLTFATASLFLTAHLLPWRLIFFFGGNGAIISSHPAVQQFINQSTEPSGVDGVDGKSEQKPSASGLDKIAPPKPGSSLQTMLTPLSEISLDSSPEEREVEIFELQHRAVFPFSSTSEWETILFSPLPYDPLSPSRIAGDRPRGCRFFEDVQSPLGWAWKSKKWELDLECREWVVERMITGVGFEIPSSGPVGNGNTALTEDQVGGWVWDLPTVISQTPMNDDELDMMAYGDLNVSAPSAEPKSKGKVKVKGGQGRDWEESMQAQKAGEWRRRRWVRVVHRIPTAERASFRKSTRN